MLIPPAVDVVCNLFTPEVVASRPGWTSNFLEGKVNVASSVTSGLPVEAMLEEMDDVGIYHAILIAPILGSGHPATWRLEYEVIADAVRQHPTRFSGIAGLDPTEGMAGVRRLEYAINDLGFVGAHFYPHWFGLAPDDRKWYPFYTKCAELEVPIQLQVGHCFRYTDDYPLRTVARPISLDAVACDFPDLRIVASHIGWPWVEEMISMSVKHSNIFISSDAHAPQYWDEAFVRYIDSRGSDKVLFGTDFPVIGFHRAIDEISKLDIRDSSLLKFMQTNAISVYGLKDLPSTL